MSSATFVKRRGAPRQRLGRLATMLVGGGVPPRCVSSTDSSDGGVRVNSNGVEIPDVFELRFSDSGHFRDGAYQVIWRNDPVVGAKIPGPSQGT